MESINYSATVNDNRPAIIKKEAIAVTKNLDGSYLIDNRAVVISPAKIPEHMIGKSISSPNFCYYDTAEELKNERLTIMKSVEKEFKSFYISNKIKYKSRTYYKYQQIYFNGAAVAMGGEFPARWGVLIMSGREIIDSYTY